MAGAGGGAAVAGWVVLGGRVGPGGLGAAGVGPAVMAGPGEEVGDGAGGDAAAAASRGDAVADLGGVAGDGFDEGAEADDLAVFDQHPRGGREGRAGALG